MRNAHREIKMPQLGKSVHEGTPGRWLKQAGEPVAKYEPLVEVITDKVNVEMPSPYAGVLAKILVQEGQTVTAGTVIALVEERAARRPRIAAVTAMSPDRFRFAIFVLLVAVLAAAAWAVQWRYATTERGGLLRFNRLTGAREVYAYNGYALSMSYVHQVNYDWAKQLRPYYAKTPSTPTAPCNSTRLTD